MDRQYSTRFLDAFAHIEQALADMSGADRHKPFYQLVTDTARIDPFVNDIAIELKEFGDLRNAIVHERINDEPIAEPHPEIVRRIEKIRDLLQSPPKVEDEFLGPVVICRPSDLVGTAAQLMYKHAFSKIPVYDRDVFIGLLTAEAITHWLGAQLLDKTSTLHDETVLSVLRYVQETTSFRFVPRECPMFEVMGLFEDASRRGQRLQAVIITEDGTKTTKPIGIITAFDLPKIYNTMNNR